MIPEISATDVSRKRAAEDNQEDAPPEKVRAQMDIRKDFSNEFSNKALGNTVVQLKLIKTNHFT
jgi:hypothetical protein